jgi:reversion-inducing cysteine-rich kazal motif protein
MDALAEKCSPVLPQSPMWSCLLKSGSTKPARLPLDAGKLACCTKATRSSCQNLCWRAFQADWESAWVQLDALCLSSSLEGELRRCLEDADDSCEMGCSGLSYCARFNDRPTTLFRYRFENPIKIRLKSKISNRSSQKDRASLLGKSVDLASSSDSNLFNRR